MLRLCHCGAKRLHGSVINDVRNDDRADIRKHLGEHEPVHPDEGIQDKQHRYIENSPPYDRQQKRNASVSDRLEEKYQMEAQEHKCCRNAPDPQKFRPDPDRLFISDELPHDLRGRTPVFSRGSDCLWTLSS